MNIVNVESLKKFSQDDLNNETETIHDTDNNDDDKIVVGVLLPRHLEGNNDVVAKEHGVGFNLQFLCTIDYYYYMNY